MSNANDRPENAPAQDPRGVAPVAPGPAPALEARATAPEGTRPTPGRLEPAAAIGAGFPFVGIGASAGGLAAFEAFFSGMPADTDPGMAFVLVQHLAPDHKSLLSELVRRYTRMDVFEVGDGMVVRPNCTYIIPPNHDMAFLNGAALLMNVRERVPSDQRDAALAKLDRLSRADILEPYRTYRLSKQGSTVEDSITATRLVNETGRVYAIAATERAVEGGAP